MKGHNTLKKPENPAPTPVAQRPEVCEGEMQNFPKPSLWARCLRAVLLFAVVCALGAVVGVCIGRMILRRSRLPLAEKTAPSGPAAAAQMQRSLRAAAFKRA